MKRSTPLRILGDIAYEISDRAYGLAEWLWTRSITKTESLESIQKELIGDVERYGRWVIHAKARCEGQPCTFHNPSQHHMRDWGIHIRMDQSALVERICEHGRGHPDPDSLAYFMARGETGMDVHGCDGCCWPPSEGAA